MWVCRFATFINAVGNYLKRKGVINPLTAMTQRTVLACSVNPAPHPGHAGTAQSDGQTDRRAEMHAQRGTAGLLLCTGPGPSLALIDSISALGHRLGPWRRMAGLAHLQKGRSGVRRSRLEKKIKLDTQTMIFLLVKHPLLSSTPSPASCRNLFGCMESC